MGMFDNIIVPYELLPLTFKEQQLISDDQEWQTKDLDSTLESYFITKDGVFLRERTEIKVTYPGDKTADSLLERMGQWDMIVHPVEKYDFTGELYFYGHNTKNHWLEFRTEFKSGILISIIKDNERTDD